MTRSTASALAIGILLTSACETSLSTLPWTREDLMEDIDAHSERAHGFEVTPEALVDCELTMPPPEGAVGWGVETGLVLRVERTGNTELVETGQRVIMVQSPPETEWDLSSEHAIVFAWELSYPSDDAAIICDSEPAAHFLRLHHHYKMLENDPAENRVILSHEEIYTQVESWRGRTSISQLSPIQPFFPVERDPEETPPAE